MKSSKALLILALIVLLGAVAGVIFVKKRRRELLSYPPPKVYPIPVEYAVARKGKKRETFRYIGEVLPYTYATVSTKVAGTVLKVYKREGEHFRRGELLARIDSSQIENTVLSLENERRAKESLLSGLKSQLRAAQVKAENAEREYERELFLFKRGAVSKEEVERYQNAYRLSSAEVKSIESQIRELKLAVRSIERRRRAAASQLNYTQIRAVRSGTVAKLLAYPGDVAVPGKPIMRVFYDSDGFRVLVNVPPEEAKEIAVGSPVSVEGKVRGKVEKIYPAADLRTNLYTVEVKLESAEGLKPKQLVETVFRGKAYSGIIVPSSSILHLKGKDVVLVVEGGRVRPVRVDLLKRVNRWAVVSGELKGGEKVVVGRESKLLEVMRRKSAVPVEAFNG